MIEGQTLFVTEVGSRMWGMATPESDYDHVVVYQVPTRRILEGHRVPETRPTRQYVDEAGRALVQAGRVGGGHAVRHPSLSTAAFIRSGR